MKSAEFHRATERRLRTTRAQLREKVAVALEAQPLTSLDYALAINASQNVLREAMESVFAEVLPQPRQFFGEMAIRCACYCITALHPDDQEATMMEVREHLMSKLADMQAAGHGIQTEWE